MNRQSNAEFNEAFRRRTFEFAVRVLDYVDKNKMMMPYVINQQLCKSATSVGANFRAFCRGRSARERYAKICIVVEEADETMYWLELISTREANHSQELSWIYAESEEITKVVSRIKKSFEKSS